MGWGGGVSNVRSACPLESTVRRCRRALRLAARAGTDLSSGLAAMRGAPREASVPREMPTIVLHGDWDAVVSPINGTHVIEASFGVDCSFDCCEQAGPDGRRLTRCNYTRSGVCGEHWTLHDEPHAWSGGSLAGADGEVKAAPSDCALQLAELGVRIVARRCQPAMNSVARTRSSARAFSSS